MKIVKYLSLLLILGVACVCLITQFFLIRIDLGEVGVRTQQYAFLGDKGVVKEDFGPGYHRNLPLLDTWNVFDATVQTTEFTTMQQRQATKRIFDFLSSSTKRYLDSTPEDGPEQIELKSKDGYSVKLDITVKYRITPGQAFDLYQKFNSESGYKRIVRDQVQEVIRTVLGKITTEQFYNPIVRREKTNLCIDQLREVLKDRNIDLVSILIRDISFDPSYERKILDKKLADQDVELNKSRALAEEKKGETNRIDAETGAKVQVIQQELRADQLTIKAETDKTIAQINADARLTAAKLRADADLYKAELEAKGQLLEKQANAEGERLKAGALNANGGQNLVAYELVKNLDLEDMTVSTLQYDFLDVQSILERVGAETDSKE